MPLPTSLVVKKGSKIRFRRLGVHAAAAVADRDGDIGAAPALRSRCEARRRRGIASRALIAMLRSAVSNWLGSASIAPTSPSSSSSRPRSASPACGRAFRSGRRSDRLTIEHLAAAAAGGGRRRAAGRSAARRARRSRRSPRDSGACFSSVRPGRRSRSAEPRITVSRLLKSWATPPVSSAERLHLLRLRERFAGAVQLLLGAPALGHVAGDLGEADQRAVLVEDRVDDHARPEARAVLAHPPALGLELALLRGDREAPAQGTPAARSSSV